ncbi:TraB/GumN family protein [Terrimonas sp. NA20]|uniref:TraB/GumN family protein n=1 Tax=Terrimonas ginsenosidimutans TaxID=2908004 RepID=A0ABS9KX63_9BACT|nr:TraB/GumN family protein [Terrimonas ginsenosidimutans]MCG2616910.1 TraB/GumN family protein [Terrimonas ginsenosidimutans]
MKRFVFLLLFTLPLLADAQSRTRTRNYPSLLWEISGNGMKKPSYLFGTMHVSSKLAFHLADSFYIGIRNADVVALETNPESWQEDMSKYDLDDGYSAYRGKYAAALAPSDYLRMRTLSFGKYDDKIERALHSNPSTINNLLYRSYGNASSDFEEDTYLDMYIYQCGKKWGKKVAGVERYGESMRLMAEAYRDAAKDKNKRERSYDQDDNFSSGKLQEAYRSGNLDWLDSINKFNSFSRAFDEKFLYKRNEIQAGSIDSILKSGLSLFVGVGAAHLPGGRGVIEMLREKGYRLRPVKMGARDSQHKGQVEKIRVPVQFATQTSDDGFFKVDMPGKLYQLGEDPAIDQRQYADMANGSYYMVSRIITNAWMWGQSADRVQRVVDSLLYENIPGKIISKTSVVRNGYPGIDIINKTRRGDIQRYNIFVTPSEILIFKISGTGDYVTQGLEAQRFFSSIQLKERHLATGVAGWKKYSPAYGGFSIDMPHEPFTGNNGNRIFDAEDKSTNTQYRVLRTDIHNYRFVEEDTFDLGLMEESFAASDFIDKQLSRQHTTANGYPALDLKYKDKQGAVYLVRFLIQGTHYYTLIAHGQREVPAMINFINSFVIKPLIYPSPVLRTDTSLFFQVRTPVFPDDKKEKIDLPAISMYNYPADDDADEIASGVFRSNTISNDTTGEKIFVSFFRSPRYTYLEDSTILEKEHLFGDSSWIVRKKISTVLPNKMKAWEVILSDSGSSRMLWEKTFYKDGIGFSIMTQGDTLTAPSSFVKSFFETFTPADTLQGSDMFVKKSNLFFEDFLSKDSAIHRRAVKGIYLVKLDSSDIGGLKKVMSTIGWSEKDYLGVKKQLIRKLVVMKDPAATNYLKELYQAAGDTLELQYAILGSMVDQQTSYSYKTFRDIVMAEPPVLSLRNDLNGNQSLRYAGVNSEVRLIEGLGDSLKLAKAILPDILPLINLDDYKYPMMTLLSQMIDSGWVKPDDYKAYYQRFLLEAKQEWKRQVISEKQKSIDKAKEAQDDELVMSPYYSGTDEEAESGNDNLNLYANLLMPYWNKDKQVPALVNQLLASSDKKLKYSILISLIRLKKPYPDTLVNYFAGLDEYRYSLYQDLEELEKSALFPAAENNQLALSRSKLLSDNVRKPDSLLFIDKIKATVKGREGWVYFFKYKIKKDDARWGIASVGLISLDSAKYEWEVGPGGEKFDEEIDEYGSEYDFTAFSETKLKEDEPEFPQLQQELKKMLYSKRKSAKEFYGQYDRANYGSDELNITIDEEPE